MNEEKQKVELRIEVTGRHPAVPGSIDGIHRSRSLPNFPRLSGRSTKQAFWDQFNSSEQTTFLLNDFLKSCVPAHALELMTSAGHGLLSIGTDQCSSSVFCVLGRLSFNPSALWVRFSFKGRAIRRCRFDSLRPIGKGADLVVSLSVSASCAFDR